MPVNKPVQFVMTSEDVLHDFYIPTMRVKHDIVPGRYTEVWFAPTVEGLHRVTCAEYCGKGHSDMKAKMFVDDSRRVREVDGEGGDEWKTMTPQECGEAAVQSKGCADLPHHRRHQGQGPSWKGMCGKIGEGRDGKEYKV